MIMPPVSESQRKAMYAAKAGKSNIGIPQKVGAEFVKADPGGKLPQKAKKYDLGGYVKSGTMAEQLDRPMGGPVLTTKSRFYKNYPDPFRTSIEEQDYDKPKAAHKRPKGKG